MFGGINGIDVAGPCECGSELSGCINCGNFLDWLRTCYLLKKDCAPYSYLVVGMRTCFVFSVPVNKIMNFRISQMGVGGFID